MKPWLRLSMGAALGFAALSTFLFGCSKKDVEQVIGTDVRGQVTDNRGQPVAGATVRLYTALGNGFVQGSDIAAGEAYINREAVLASTSTEKTIETGADGHFTMTAIPNAFLAVAVKAGCSAGFAGFDDATGTLTFDTLIKPSFTNGVHFDIPQFVLACATPPEVGPEGNTNEAIPFEPPNDAGPTCDPIACGASGGTCDDAGGCVALCVPAACAASGGACEAGACVTPPPTCNPTACAATGGSCQQGICVPPACDPSVCAASGGSCAGAVCNVPVCDPAHCADAGGTCSADGGACVIPACNAASCADAGGSCAPNGGVCLIPACSPTACAAAGGTCAADGGTCVIPTCDRAQCADAGGSCDPDGGTCVIPPACNPSACAASGGTCGADGGGCVIPACNPTACAAAGGACGADGGACVIPTCDPTSCADAGGSCGGEGGVCVIPPCLAKAAACKAAHGVCSADGTTCVIPPCLANEAACQAASGRCSADGKTCQVPACKVDTDCQALQADAVCVNPGNIDLAKCEPPPADDIVPPVVAKGFRSFRITDETGQTVLADASSANQKILSSQIPKDENGLPSVVRIYGTYTGAATQAFLQVQSGGHGCVHHRLRTDYIGVDLEDGSDGLKTLSSETSDYVELVLHGGYQKIQLTTSERLGQGEQSFTIEIGERCAPPAFPFIAILTWEGGRRHQADLDLNIWNAAGDLVFVGNRKWPWGRFGHHWGRGPGPEVFLGFGPVKQQGPLTIKVQFFSGRPRPVHGKVRIIRLVGDDVKDQTYTFTVNKPKDVVEIGKFATQ